MYLHHTSLCTSKTPNQPPYTSYLNIDVAERTSESVHRIRDLNARSIDTQIDIILQSAISAGWGVVQCDCSGNGVLSVLEILVLPDPPCAVDLCVVEEEGWVSRGGEDVSAWITANSEVSSGMYATVEKTELVTLYLSGVWRQNL
jgi:hypothetical protein